MKPRFEIDYISETEIDIVTRTRVPIENFLNNADQLQAVRAKPVPGGAPKFIELAAEELTCKTCRHFQADMVGNTYCVIGGDGGPGRGLSENDSCWNHQAASDA